MKTLINSAKIAIEETHELPFSVYSSLKEQRIKNVPVIKPLLIFILSGQKKLGKDKVVCPTGTFVFLSNSPNIDMRNIPADEEYFAVLIEFDYSDFDQFQYKQTNSSKYIIGEIDTVLTKALNQFIELSTYIPAEALHFRKKELLQLIYMCGYEDVTAMAAPPSLGHQIHDIIREDITLDWPVKCLAERLFMSESTLRRKLKTEGTSIQAIKNRTRLGYGLHLIQTTSDSIGRIAQNCGYQSQSRFTDQFKLLFSLTPSELRKTKVDD